MIARHVPLAFTQLIDHAQIKGSDWFLVMGAAGGLGSAGVQAARSLGARVIAAAGTDSRVDTALRLGADFGVNYRSQNLVDEVQRITNGKGVDIVMENIGAPDLFPQALYALAKGGRMVTAGAHGGGQVSLDVRHLYQNRLNIIGAPVENSAYYATGFQAYLDGKYHVNIAQRFSLGQTAQAHALVETDAVQGEVIIEPQRFTPRTPR